MWALVLLRPFLQAIRDESEVQQKGFTSAWWKSQADSVEHWVGEQGRERAFNNPELALELGWQTLNLNVCLPGKRVNFSHQKHLLFVPWPRDFATFQAKRCQHSPGRSSPSALVSLINISLPLFWRKKKQTCSFAQLLAFSLWVLISRLSQW